MRLDCVLPCIGGEGPNGPEAKGFVLQSSPWTFDDCVAAIENDPALRKGFEGALRIRE